MNKKSKRITMRNVVNDYVSGNMTEEEYELSLVYVSQDYDFKSIKQILNSTKDREFLIQENIIASSSVRGLFR